MKHSFCLFLGLFLSAGLSRAQEAAPYNPDANNDQFINTPDLMSLLALYNGPFFAPDDDLDPFNELQTLVLDGNVLSLEPGGGSVELPAGLNGIHCWDLNGDGINDPEEDSNGDGIFNALDCQGAAPAGNCAVFGDFFDIPIGEELIAPSDGIIIAQIEGAPGWSLPPSTGFVILTDSVQGFPNKILVAEEEGYYVDNNVTRTGGTMPVKSGWFYQVNSLGGATVNARFLPFLACNQGDGFWNAEYRSAANSVPSPVNPPLVQAQRRIQFLVHPFQPEGLTLYDWPQVPDNITIELAAFGYAKGSFTLPKGREGQRIVVCLAAGTSLRKAAIRTDIDNSATIGSLRADEAWEFIYSGGRWLSLR